MSTSACRRQSFITQLDQHNFANDDNEDLKAQESLRWTWLFEAGEVMQEEQRGANWDLGCHKMTLKFISEMCKQVFSRSFLLHFSK
jgi:hypothetical protein